MPVYLQLNNNCLSEIGDIKEVASGLFEDVDSVAWLDLSFNELTKVDDVSTCYKKSFSTKLAFYD